MIERDWIRSACEIAIAASAVFSAWRSWRNGRQGKATEERVQMLPKVVAEEIFRAAGGLGNQQGNGNVKGKTGV